MSIVPNYSRLAVSKTELDNRRQVFAERYVLSNCATGFGGAEVNLPLTDVVQAVSMFMHAYELSPESVGIVLVPSFNTTSQALYYRFLICDAMYSETVDDFAILTVGYRYASYQASDGVFTPSRDIALADSNYLNNFYYVANPPCSVNGSTSLSEDTACDTYVRRIYISWGYVLKALLDQNITGMPENEFNLCIAASSHLVSDGGVAYPHDVTIYLKRGTIPLLDDRIDPAYAIRHKGANLYCRSPPLGDGMITVPL